MKMPSQMKQMQRGKPAVQFHSFQTHSSSIWDTVFGSHNSCLVALSALSTTVSRLFAKSIASWACKSGVNSLRWAISSFLEAFSFLHTSSSIVHYFSCVSKVLHSSTTEPSITFCLACSSLSTLLSCCNLPVVRVESSSFCFHS